MQSLQLELLVTVRAAMRSAQIERHAKVSLLKQSTVFLQKLKDPPYVYFCVNRLSGITSGYEQQIKEKNH